MNRQHNIGLCVVCFMVVACVAMLRGHQDNQALVLVMQFAGTIGGGIVGNAMRDQHKQGNGG